MAWSPGSSYRRSITGHSFMQGPAIVLPQVTAAMGDLDQYSDHILAFRASDSDLLSSDM